MRTLQVTRLRYRHPVEKNFLKTIYTISTPRGVPKRSFVSYEWHVDPYEVYGLPHGNARYSVESYQPAMASEREVCYYNLAYLYASTCNY
jgi:hypothetical protein